MTRSAGPARTVLAGPSLAVAGRYGDSGDDLTYGDDAVIVKKLCGRVLRVESYGGGTRYACPACDRGAMFKSPSLVWTNGRPPSSLTCQNVVGECEVDGPEAS